MKFNELSQFDQANVLRMAQRLCPLRLIIAAGDESTIEPDFEFLLDSLSEHYTHMNKITGGAYGAADMDV